MNWTPATIDTATRDAAVLAFEAHDLADTLTRRHDRILARLIEERCQDLLAEIPAGYPEIIEADANPGGWVAILVDTDGHQTRYLWHDQQSATPMRQAWTAGIVDGTAWRLVIFDGDEGLCPLEVWTPAMFQPPPTSSTPDA